MRKLALTSLCALLVLALSAPTLQAAAAKPTGSAEDAIRRTSQEFVAAWNVHDAAKMAAVWATNGDLINPFGRHAKGRPEVQKLFVDEQSTMFKSSTYSIDSNDIRMLSPTVAVADWESTVTGMTDPTGNPAPPFKHHVTVVMQLEGGAWRVAAARPILYPPPPAPAPMH